MNTSLFTSTWALTGILISVGFVAWLGAAGAVPGTRLGSHPEIVLWSGWVAFALMVIICAYSLRKFVHKLGISPEMRWQVSQENLERCESRLNELRSSITTGLLTNRAEVQEIVERVLREEGVQRICRAVVKESHGVPALKVQLRPTEPLGRMARWLHFHVYLGLASGVVLFVHGGASLTSPLGAALNLLSAFVIVTGIFGTLLFAVGPAWMTRREREMGFEEASVRYGSLKSKLKEAFKDIEPAHAKILKAAARSADRPTRAQAALEKAVALAPEGREEFEDIMALASQRQHVLAELKALRRIRGWMNVWRLLHVPASVVLLGLSLVHIYQVWRW